MTLTGNLEVFPLEEVLRMLARSRKSGCLRIDSAGLQGSVYLNGGALTFASTSTDDEFRRQLLSSGLVEESKFRKVELSGASLAEVLAEDVSSATLSDFVREHVVESLFRIRRGGRGTFDFSVDHAPRYPTAQSFDVDVMLTEADRRAAEWEEIESVVPDSRANMRMIAELVDDEPVTLSPQTWRVLAALGGGSSVIDMSRRFGMSEFRTSRELAGLVRNGLVAPAEDVIDAEAQPEPSAMPEEVEDAAPSETESAHEPAEAESTQPEPVSGEPTPSEAVEAIQPEDEVGAPDLPEASEPEAVAGDESPPQWAPPAQEAEAQAAAPASHEVADTPWERSTWTVESNEPRPDNEASAWAGWGSDESDEAQSEETSPTDAEPAEGQEGAGGWWAQTMGEAESASEGADSDADKFLESVFSSLSDQEEGAGDGADDETGFGLGLLRRRRMGAAARDLPENDR